MNAVHDQDQYVVLVRRAHQGDDSRLHEYPLMYFAFYADAENFCRENLEPGHEYVIRFLGETGGGD